MEERLKFEVVYLDEAVSFLESLDQKTRDKIVYNISKCRCEIDPELFKKLNSHIWEFRTRYNKLQFRLFAFWDKKDSSGTLVIATHGTIKKSDKVLRSDIARAMDVRDKYFDEKYLE